MSTDNETTDQTSRRAELVRELLYAGRVHSTAAVLYHTALAARQGLTATEEKALDLLVRFGPMTAGELARRSGLAPASVTGLLNRMEKKGYARRVPDVKDKRRVLVEVCADRFAEAVPLFDDFLGSLSELLAGYTDEQLETIIHFLNEAARRQSEATSKLAQ